MTTPLEQLRVVTSMSAASPPKACPKRAMLERCKQRIDPGQVGSLVCQRRIGKEIDSLS